MACFYFWVSNYCQNGHKVFGPLILDSGEQSKNGIRAIIFSFFTKLQCDSCGYWILELHISFKLTPFPHHS